MSVAATGYSPLVSVGSVIAGYELRGEIAAGGMASVHLGRSLASGSSRRIVAIKRLHPHLARDRAFANVLLQEAGITRRIQHPNVVATLDVVRDGDELLLVMEYVAGETVARLLKASKGRDVPIPVEITASVVRDMLRGLHAAHETRGEEGELLHVVHRDVSPQNVIVATDGIARVLDFGVAKIIGSLVHTKTGELKGKLPYMAPEVLRLAPATPQSDVWGASVVLWEMLCCRRLFSSDSQAEIWTQVLSAPIPTPREVLGAPTLLDDVVMRGLARDPELRFRSAAEMADAIERAVSVASPASVGSWVASLAGADLASRDELVRTYEATLVMATRPPPTAAPPAPAKAETAPATRSSRPTWPAWLLVVALALALAFVLLRRPSSATTPPPPATSAAPSMAAPSESAIELAPARTESPSALPASSSAPGRARPRPPRPGPAPSPRRTDACDPPYVVDSAGRKVFKLECIH